jgi:hypothetical protein
MADIITINSSDTLAASQSTINTNFANLQNLFRSATAPASPVAGQLWLDTSSGNVLKIRNAANSAWVSLLSNTESAGGGSLPLSGGTMTGAINMGSQQITALAAGSASTHAVNKSQVDAREHLVTVTTGAVSGTATKLLAVAPSGMTIVNAYVVNPTTISTSATNYWSIQVANQTQGFNMASTAFTTNSTGGSAITANTATSLLLNQNLTPTALDVLNVTFTATGSPTAFAADAVIVIRYKVTT